MPPDQTCTFFVLWWCIHLFFICFCFVLFVHFLRWGGVLGTPHFQFLKDFCIHIKFVNCNFNWVSYHIRLALSVQCSLTKLNQGVYKYNENICSYIELMVQLEKGFEEFGGGEKTLTWGVRRTLQLFHPVVTFCYRFTFSKKLRLYKANVDVYYVCEI